MDPVKFAVGYYKINGVPDNRSDNWYLMPSEIAITIGFYGIPQRTKLRFIRLRSARSWRHGAKPVGIWC